MSDLMLLCAVPSERADLAGAVLAAGGTPLVDLTASPRVSVPEGAWVRVRSRRNVPGTGPVVLVEGPDAGPVRKRETWLEVTIPRPAPEGFAGIVLRGAEAGGPCGAEPGLALLARVPQGTRVLLDAGTLPPQAPAARAAGAEGIVLSDVLLGLPELGLPPGLARRLAALEPAADHVVNGFRFHAGPLAPVLRRLLAGEAFWELAEGWFAADDPANRAWPLGAAAVSALELARRHGDLAGLLGAFRATDRVPAPVAPPRPRAAPPAAPPATDAVAIVGLGCRLPGAMSVAAYWDNILSARCSITEVPVERWDPALYWDPDKSAPDKTYARIGGFLTGFEFHPRRFRIPPAVARHIDEVQQTTLESVYDALVDAGLKPTPRDAEGRDFDRGRTAVILGNSMGGEVGDDYTVRVRFPAIRKALEEVPGFAALPAEARAGILSAFEEGVKQDLPPITEDSMPGELSNVVAGRVANAFDLTGANFTVDAACASSMAAVQTAVKGLLDRDFDLAITGGADRTMGVETYTKFCKIGALSPDHSAPFDATANGFVMGEGAGILVLKRLSDAERDGDRIYAVIRGIGASSDGKGKGITAPNPRGQKLALERAYAQAGLDPSQVDLFECHGTSTVVGDKVEVECLSEAIGEGRRGDRGPARIGSVKSNIGHLKSAAGAASLIKASLAVHHGVLPPSLGFRTARPDVPLDAVPLQVQTAAEPWAGGAPRRAGVSAFGFGGTNFHVVLEQHVDPAQVVDLPAAPAAPVTASRPPSGAPVPEGLWAVSARDRRELVRILESGKVEGRVFEPDAPVRLAASTTGPEERQAQLQRTLRVLQKDQPPELLRSRGIALEEEPCDGKLAFLFTGQGSQYIDMGLDLAERYDVVRRTFEEADRVMLPELGRPLSAYIRRDPALDEDVQFERLRATEISQPATLTVDIALLRLLASFGVRPDMVAGHSLGEYAACVAAGILSFEDALLAVSARGREMASVQIDDPGRMAGIATSVDKVQEVLAEIPGYVVCANKNCPTQTVIAGESDAVDAAIEAFRSRGITVYPLPVSHAFHSRIVAPASAPLRKVLERLDVRPPQRPITTNVTSRYYPSGEGAREQIIDILARQVAAPVEWIAQTERMYADGARIFIELGPKRALAGFTAAILKRRPHRALYTNHPKRGGVASLGDALAALLALGFPLAAAPGVPEVFGETAPRRATSAAQAGWRSEGEAPAPGAEASHFVVQQVLGIAAELTGYAPEELSLEDELEADLGVDTVKQAELVATVRDHFRLEHDPAFRLSDYRTLRDLANYAARRLGSFRAAGAPEPRARRLVEAPSAPVVPARPLRVAVPPVAAPALPAGALPAEALQALVAGAVQAGLQGADAAAVARAVAPALQGLVAALVAAMPAAAPVAPPAPPAPAPVPVPAPSTAAAPVHRPAGEARTEVVASGISVGLPGGDEVFAPDNFDRILAGENRISHLRDEDQDAILAKHIVRLHKDPRTGQGTFHPVEAREQVLQLAGRKAAFDLTAYGVDASLLPALDITTQLAIAAGLEALKDAGIPLVRRFRDTASGKKVPAGWGLPDALRDDTGIIFACAFPGYTNLLQHVAHNGQDPEGRFDRRFLFQILSMGHSQLAQFIGARGPNTQVNAACASSTQAVSMASDWIRLGRCRRVLVVGADDVTNEQMMEWIGAGFLVTGAATTAREVEDGALPFDKRRNGMIIGMGAVGVVVEAAEAAAERGVTPLARLLATRMANSAFHGTRLDRDHIAEQVDAFVADATAAAGVDRATFARQAVFMSHETYTPARGGSAAAEIDSLRRAFGPDASAIVVANTKGFTGHAMGAGIEDAVALEALSRGIVPPVPNLEEPDPELGDLTLSRGGRYDVRYAIRLAAGFGSQLALTAWEKVAAGPEDRVDEARNRAWLQRVTGYAWPDLVVENRTLRVVEAQAPQVLDVPVAAAPPDPAPAPATRAAADAPAGPAAPGAAAVLARVTALIAARTGYGADELEPDFELEADLGIDTVKQAEILGELREDFGIPGEVEVKLADTPTIAGLAGWIAEHADAGAAPPAPPPPAAPAPASAPDPAPPSEAVAAPSPAGAAGRSPDAVLARVTALIAERTGYEPEELEPDFELEADLGIDTVKQAEILGELREAFGIPGEVEVTLADTPTIAGLAGWLAESAGGAPSTPPSAPAVPAPAALAPAPAPAPAALAPAPPAAPAAPAAEGDLDVGAILLGIIAEKTGYEPEELEPDFELEADLGIDTVKQAEIFGEVRERLGVAQDDEFRLADYPTIGELAGWLKAQRRAAPAAAPAPEVAPQVEPVSEPAPAAPAPAEGLTARGLPESFRVRRPVIVPRAAPRPAGRLDGRCLEVLGEGPFAIALRLEALEAGASLEGEPDAVIDASDDVTVGFARARALDAARPRDWICATRLGSDPSWVDPEVGMVHGARAGLAKALHQEWPETAARLVDVDPTVDDPHAARKVLAELTAGDGALEIFHDDALRRTLELQLEELPPQAGRLQDNAVVVLTGGTRGVTARVALALARRGPVRLALLARTAPGREPLDETAEKQRIKDELLAAGERATPARIERALAPLRRAEEARQNVAAMQALGAEVRFYAVDMSDEDAVRDTLQAVRDDLGFIDGVVHGAGVEVSRLLADKDEADFARVFDGKARGGMALARNLERVAWFASMGSVAGRFGNAGQVDYAAANEAMARVCLSRPRSLHVDWTAWADTGMAVRGGMERLLTERGVELMPADAGAELLVDLVAAGVTGEVLVAGQLGGFSLPPTHPLLDAVALVGDRAIGRRRLSLDTDPWLEDHSIEGTPVLPGVIGLELMAAVAQAVRPGSFYVGARDVRFLAPVKLHGASRDRGEPTDLIITAEPLDDATVRCTLESERTARTGRTLRTLHFEGVLNLGLMPVVDPLPPTFFAEEPLSRDDIYARFFHGPAFRVLAEAESVGETALMATAVLTHAPIGAGLLTAPLVLEAAFQAAGLHRMATRGLMALPATIGQVQLDHVPPDGAPLSIMVRVEGDTYDIDVDGPDGNVLRVRGFEMVDTGPLPEGDRIPEPEGGWPMVVVATALATGAPDGAQALLPAEEVEVSARGTARRQADRRAGRRAARAAVAALAGTGAFRLASAPGGRPVVQGLPEVQVSICHREGRGWAAATGAGAPGLDLELAALRPESWLRTWFTPGEQARLAGDPVAQTRAWCAKEAVLKALGTGMALHPRDVEILDQRSHRAQILLRGEAAARHRALGGGRLVVTLGSLDGLVAAAALLAPGDGREAVRSRRVA